MVGCGAEEKEDRGGGVGELQGERGRGFMGDVAWRVCAVNSGGGVGCGVRVREDIEGVGEAERDDG